jgi:hypothetical protein
MEFQPSFWKRNVSKRTVGGDAHATTAYPLIGVLEVTSSFRRVYYQLQSQTVSRKRNPFFKKIV